MVHNNPITFYDNDGKKPTPTFKALYPVKEKNPVTGKTYRSIQEVAGGITVDVKVFELDTTYLLKGSTPAKRLVIHSHGEILPGAFGHVIRLEANTPTITVLGPHEEKLDLAIANFQEKNISYAKISYKGITLTSTQAEMAFGKGEKWNVKK